MICLEPTRHNQNSMKRLNSISANPDVSKLNIKFSWKKCIEELKAWLITHLVFVIQDCSSSAFEMDCTVISSFTLFRARALSSSSWSFKWRNRGCEQQEHCAGSFEEARNFWHPHLLTFRIFVQLPFCVNSSSSGLTWKCLWQSQDPQANGFLDKASNCWHPHISPLTTFLHSDQPIELKHLEQHRNK